MKTFFYQGNTIDLFKLLLRQPPQSIFSDEFIRVVFDYIDFHILVSPKDDDIPASQVEYDEAIKADFQYINSVYKPHEQDLLLFENNTIDRLWILQTMLYFTDTDEIFYHGKANSVHEFTGGHGEYVCHSQSKEAKGVNKEFANLIDAGIMLEIGSKLLMCFSYHNGFGIVGKVMSPNEIKEDIMPFYELIEIV